MHDIEATLPIGHSLQGQYTVIEVLGQGASCAVYLVKDERDSQKRLVLKEVKNAHYKERNDFSFDAAALKRLYHPALPDIYKVFSDKKSDEFYILMDYVEGSNLEEVRQLMPGKRFSLHTALTLLSPIMDATSYLHRQQPHLVHGDIKPSNIIASLTGSTTPTKLVDFGGADNSFTDISDQQSTFNYRAPEQFGKRASRRTDVYGLGATFYTLLTGKIPVAAPERLAQIDQGNPDPLLPVNKINPFVHEIVAEAISCAMSLSRNDRYASVEQFREALWQVMHAKDMDAQAPDFSFMVAAEELTKAETGPDSSMLESDSPALIAYALMQEEVTFAGVNSGPLRTSPFPKQDSLPDEVSSQERPGVVHRKKHRVHANSESHGTYRRRKRKRKPIFLAGLVLLVICICGSSVAIAGSQIYNTKYQNKVAMAQEGIKYLQSAITLMQAWSKNPLETSSITRAQHEFSEASAVFTQLDSDLQSYARFGALIPGMGTRLNSALHLVPIATEVSQAGVAGCEALNVIVSRFHEPFDIGHGITTTDLSQVDNDLHTVEANISTAIRQVKTLQPADLQFDARIGKAVMLFHQYLPTVQTFLSQADQVLPALAGLLGISSPAYYLVEILDSTQLRPGGGFIKDYGFATFRGGRLSAADITDTNLLDNQFNNNGNTIPYPQQYNWFHLASNTQGWNLRDSNLDADFPKDASYAEKNFLQEGGITTPQGVIAITTTLMQHALAITGPIIIPKLNERVTEKNLIERIHFYQTNPGSRIGGSILTPSGIATGSRYFTTLLAHAFLDSIHKVSASDVPRLVQMLVSSLRTKDLQIYFNDTHVEDLLKLSNINATIQAPPASDSLFVVDTNIAGDTANQYITNMLNDQVTIDEGGNVTHHTVLNYTWLNNGTVYGSPLYRDYVRIYVPPGSSLQHQQGWTPGGTSPAFGREVWAGSFTLSSGQTNTIILTWTEKSVAIKNAAGWHYQYLVQRQAGVTWTLNINVTLPACVVKMRTSGGLVPHNSQQEMLKKFLTEDTNLGIDYSC
jgi:serine/threonine protein kinase